jgi:hypothetical protein
MTPQERALVTELFDRLAALESAPRDADAERAIADGLARAPHGVYALVQTVLVQDEALKRANARITELEGPGGEPPRQGGFLDNMRDALLGRDERHGSVPSVRPGGLGTSGVWNAGGAPAGPASYGQPAMGPSFGGGGSFLGTAAASAAGVIGGAMLLSGIRSMFGHSYGTNAFDPGLAPPPADAAWGGSAAGSDLARQAGIDSIDRFGSSGRGDDSSRAGLFGNGDDKDDGGYADSNDASDFSGDVGGGGDSDSA